MKNKAARDGVRPYWLLPYYFEVPVDGLVLEPVLPDVLLLGVLADVSVDVLPEALDPVLEPYWRRHWSRSRPVLPRHWLGVVELLPAAAPASVLELVLPPALEPVLGELALDPLLELGELVLEPVLELGELVEPLVELGELIDPLLELLPVAPADVPALPLDCAHEAPATATNAAATAAAIVLTITIESPWSVEQELQRPTCKTGANRPVVRFRPDAAAREVAACTTPLARTLSPRRVIHARKAAHRLLAERSLLFAERHASFAGAEPRAHIRRRLRHGARRRALPLRRHGQQAVLRRQPLARGIPQSVTRGK